MRAEYDKLIRCYQCVRSKLDEIDFSPRIGIVLGSGLGDYAKNVQVVFELAYREIADFPVSTVPGHDGKFVFGFIKTVPVVLMKGRVHYYEGYDISDVVLPVRLMKLLGIEALILTNAAGGINLSFHPGSLMLLTDHISLFVPNPLIGQNMDALGTRFPDMSQVYDPTLQKLIKETAENEQIPLEKGVYVQLTGPSYESPAEIRMLKALGADAVGMSTVVEAIAARHAGLKLCAISCISNYAAGLGQAELSHEEVQKAADEAAPYFEKLLTKSVIAISQYLEQNGHL